MQRVSVGDDTFQSLAFDISVEMILNGMSAGCRVEELAAPGSRSPDLNDDYLIVLADVSCSDDADLFELSDQIPVYSPAEFLAMIHNRDSHPT